MSDVARAALVTGAQRGIGRAIALALARRGFDVALADIEKSEALLDVAAAVRALGRRALPIAADIARIDGHTILLDEAENALGPLQCLVNNAGVSVLSRGDLLDVTPESYDRCLQINTRGTFFLMQAFARRLVARPSGEVPRSIVTITSSNAVAASVQRGEYCVSKSALSMATTLFAVRLAEHGIGVYEVQPGLIATDMTAPSRSRYDDHIAHGLLAMPRWGEPEEVARVVATLADEGLPYTVGQAIRVEGGLLTPRF